MAQEVITLAKQETSEEILEIVKGIRTTTGNIQTGLTGIDDKLVMDGKLWAYKTASNKITGSYDSSSQTLFSLNSVSGKQRLFLYAEISLVSSLPASESLNRLWAEIYFNNVKIVHMTPIGSSRVNSKIALRFLKFDEGVSIQQNEFDVGSTITLDYAKNGIIRFICTSYPILKNLRLIVHMASNASAGYSSSAEYAVRYLEEVSQIPIK